MTTLLETITDYLASRAKRIKPQSCRLYTGLLRQLPAPVLLRRIDGLRECDIETALDGLRCGARRTNQLIGLLKSSLAWAARNGFVAKSPAEHIELRETEPTEVDPMRHDELVRVIAAAEPWLANLITCLAFTGLRPRELTGLEWSAVDFEHKLIRVRQTALPDGSLGSPKTRGSKRDVLMIERVAKALSAQRSATGTKRYVFGNSVDRPLDLTTIRKHWARALATAGLPYRKIYSLRHSYTSYMITAGASIQETAQQLGHSTIGQVIATYSRFTRPPQSASKLDAFDRAQGTP